MPRNGTTGIATQPVNTRAVTGETIMAEKWNSVTDDVYSILSTSTPLTQGGTGASTAEGARTALAVYSTTEIDTTVSGINTSISAKAGKATTIAAGDGLTGGGSLASSRTISADIADSSAIAAGTAKKLVDAAGLKTVIDALDSDPYVSPEISIVTSSLTTLTHSLGAEPRRMQAYLVCKTADRGYSVGEKVIIDGAFYMGSGNDMSGIQIAKTATNLFLSFGNYLPIIVAKTGGTGTYITAANWRLVVEASL